MRINRKLHERIKERDGNEMKCLACMKHRVKWLVKQDKMIMKY